MAIMITKQTLIVLIAMTLGFGWLLFDAGLLLIWVEDEEYGHGLMVIAILAYVLYRNQDALMTPPTAPSWFGVIVSFVALLMFLLGELSGIAPIQL